jgi:hypothetical protein
MIGLDSSGKRVRIIEDCRDGAPASGKFGVCEGDFKRSVAFGIVRADGSDPVFSDVEAPYELYASGDLKIADGSPARDRYPEWVPGQEKPRPYFAMPMTNPRIRLEDGSVIWGDECWWEVVSDELLSLDEAQAQLQNHKAFIGGLMQAAAELHKDGADG